ncbi:MAG: aminotransferase class IV [Dokdonella sp.]
MNSTSDIRATLNGSAVNANDWRSAALASYGHFTSLLVVNRAVQGLDLHLQRLAAANLELFGTVLDTAHVRQWMAEIASDDARTFAMRVAVFSRQFNRDRPADAVAADVLITAAPMTTAGEQSISVATADYERDAPHIKHFGTFGLFHQKRLAQRRGYDDALFVDRSGAVSEGSVWNIGFLDGDGVVWPEAAMLSGVSMRLLQCGLAECDIPTRTQRVVRDDLAAFRGAFFTNSRRSFLPIRRIDDSDYTIVQADIERLQRSLATQPWQSLTE